MPLDETLSGYWRSIQGQLFPCLEEELGPLGERHKQLVTVLELVRVEAFVNHWHGLPGRPLKDRTALARAFLAKAVFNIPMTDMLIERLGVDKPRNRPVTPPYRTTNGLVTLKVQRNATATVHQSQIPQGGTLPAKRPRRTHGILRFPCSALAKHPHQQSD
jgi:hypothetical protein